MTFALLLCAGCAQSGATVAPEISPSPRAEITVSPTPSELLAPATPSPTRAPTPTPDALATVMASQTPQVETHPSPDGNWVAEILIYDCVAVGDEQQNAYQELRLTDTQSGEQHRVDSQFIYCGGLGAFGLGGRFWSPSSRFFYYTNASTGVPDGCGYFSSPYLRVDTQDFTSEYLGMGEVSPDGRNLAVWWEGEGAERQAGLLAMWDLEGGLMGVGQIPPPIRLPGPITWAPDSRSVAFLTSESSCPLGTTALSWMAVDLLVPTVLLQSSDPSFASLTWGEGNRVNLTDEQGGQWSYNFATRDLLPQVP